LGFSLDEEDVPAWSLVACSAVHGTQYRKEFLTLKIEFEKFQDESS
jgi:hypothetical protein